MHNPHRLFVRSIKAHDYTSAFLPPRSTSKVYIRVAYNQRHTRHATRDPPNVYQKSSNVTDSDDSEPKTSKLPLPKVLMFFLWNNSLRWSLDNRGPDHFNLLTAPLASTTEYTKQLGAYPAIEVLD